MPDRTEEQRKGPRTVALGVVSAAVMALIVAAALIVIATRGEGGTHVLEAPEPPAVAVAEELEPTPGGEGLPESGAVEEPPEQREPTEADAASFSATYTPPGGREVEFLVADLDADGREEIIVASIADGAVRLDVARWVGRTYEVVFTDQGGPAEELEEFSLRDVTGDGSREILTVQVAPERESLALWGVVEDGVAPQLARGGCWAGSHVYGSSGAEISRGELHATCPPDEDGGVRGATERYRWDGEAWTHEPTEDG